METTHISHIGLVVSFIVMPRPHLEMGPCFVDFCYEYSIVILETMKVESTSNFRSGH